MKGSNINVKLPETETCHSRRIPIKNETKEKVSAIIERIREKGPKTLGISAWNCKILILKELKLATRDEFQLKMKRYRKKKISREKFYFWQNLLATTERKRA